MTRLFIFVIAYASLSMLIMVGCMESHHDAIFSSNTAASLSEDNPSEDDRLLREDSPSLRGLERDFNVFISNAHNTTALLRAFITATLIETKEDGTPMVVDAPLYMSSGSGVIISDDGYIVSCEHLLNIDDINFLAKGKAYVQATIPGTTLGMNTTVVFTNGSLDFSLIKINNAKDMPYMSLGDSSSVRLGDTVIAVGYPLGADTPTFTVGAVLAEKVSSGKFLQFNTVINKGNSGGPLFDRYGQVIGITIFLFHVKDEFNQHNETYSGISAAATINEAKRLIGTYELEQKEFLGATFSQIRYSVRLQGVYIKEVLLNSSADRAGLQRGQRIRRINGVTIHNVQDAIAELNLHGNNPYESVSISIEGISEPIMMPPSKSGYYGLILDDEYWVERDEVQVDSVIGDSPMERSDMAVGDVITAIDSKPITNEAHLIYTLMSKADGHTVNVTYKRSSQILTESITMGVKKIDTIDYRHKP